ncbi:MAG: oxygen-dependent coproporphyrinogen oxidase [Halobacteriovoraceae bacterium]|nr:oxygen-dependent coproporphyrinogen oxidase [Halobacteriovoraceae bacterium]|tara:strand:+ start:1976 stop:2866 length:891 start_codon:yes stop_codon:yes gene_type:complete
MLDDYKIRFSSHVKHLQNQITEKMQDLDIEIELLEDRWSRTDHQGSPGGGGITRAFQGQTFENAGVNTSEVFGAINPDFAKKLNGTGDDLWATGISLIIHPRNPKVPTVHANFRMIQQGEKFWFGGGADLTPFYPHEEDFEYFHQVWKKACKPYECYDWMKEECDKYFVNHHRGGEMRGIGGIFFDHYNSGDLEADFNMVTDLSNHFIESYFPIVEKRINEAFDKEDEEFQLHRRGRYVEFNLLHDRGTLFGLRTNGRTDSILISLPARCKYTYKFSPKENSPHAKMMEYYFPKNW